MSTATTLTHEQMVKEFIALKAENERLKANGKTPGLGIKVSTKGAVSVYGLGRWPVTLYAGQWADLLAKSAAITKFIEENKAVLSVKAE